MSHPPPYTFRMKNKNKVSLCSKPITFALSLTPPFHTESLRGSEVLSQCKRSQLIQQFPEPTHVCQLLHLLFEISNLKSQICNSSHDLDINDFAFSAFVHFFAAI